MKRILAVMIAIAIALGGTPSFKILKDNLSVVANAGYIENDFKYELQDTINKTITITSYIGNSKSVTVPAKINGAKVESIGAEAFLGNENITSVKIEEGIEIIDTFAFAGCTNLSAVTLPNSIKAIYSEAFAGTAIMKNPKNWVDGCFYISNALVTFDRSVNVMNIKNGTVFISNSVMEYGPSAMNDQTVQKVNIPDSVKYIGDGAFDCCFGLREINVNGNNKNYSSVSGLLYNKDKTELIKVPANTGLKSITIPSSVNHVCGTAFYGCKNVQSIKVFNPNTTFGYDVFTDSSINTIYAPKNSYAEEAARDYGINFVILKLIPATPQISKLTGYKGVTVYWNSVKNADYYRVYRKTAKTNWKYICRTKELKFLDTKAPSGQTLYYTLRAESGDGLSGYNTKGTVIKYTDTPIAKYAKSTSKGVEVSWNGISGADSYRLYRRATKTSRWVMVCETKSTKFVDTKQSKNYTAYYTVRAIDNKILSNFDATGKMYIGTPDMYKGKVTTKGVEVNFKAVQGATNYRIYRKTTSSNWVYIGNSKTNKYLDTKAVSGQTLYYTARAESSLGLSSYENGYGVKYLKAPVIKSVNRNSKGNEIKWSAISGANNYRIYRHYGNGKWIYIGNSATTSFVDTKTSINSTCYYTVRAEYNKILSSYYSGVQYLKAPKITNAVSNGGIVTVNWEKVDGAVNYRVYRKVNFSSWKYIGNVKENSYKDTSAPKGATLTYTVRAENTFTYGPYNSTASVKN